MNPHEGLCPPFALTQFVYARDRLLDDFKCMATICDAKLRFTVFEILKFRGIYFRNGHPKQSSLVVELEFLAKVNDPAILPVESRRTRFYCIHHIAERFLLLRGWSHVSIATFQLCGCRERQPRFKMEQTRVRWIV